MFRVKLENGHEILAHTAGRMRKHRIRRRRRKLKKIKKKKRKRN